MAWQAHRTKFNVLQPDSGSGCQLVNFPWPISTSTSNTSLAWPALTAWSRRDFCLYCYPPSHQNSFPIIPLHYTVSIVQISPWDITGIADIIKPLLGQLQCCTVFQWCRKWVRRVVLLFWVRCKAPSKSTWDGGWESAASPLRWGHCHYPTWGAVREIPLSKHIYGNKAVKRHFTEPVAHLQPAHSCLVVWTSFMFPSGTLEPEISSTRDFFYRKI